MGALAFLIVFLSLPTTVGRSSKQLKGLAWWQLVKRFEPVGTVLLLPSVVSLLLALQWGSVQYPWSDGRVLAVLVVFGVTVIAWLGVHWSQGDRAMMPLSIAS